MSLPYRHVALHPFKSQCSVAKSISYLSSLCIIQVPPHLTKKRIVDHIVNFVVLKETAAAAAAAAGEGGDNREGNRDEEDDEQQEANSEPDPPSEEEGMQKIYIKISPVKTIVFCVNPTDTIYLLKSLIYARENIPRRSQRLHFGEVKELEDEKTLFEYDIEDGDLLDLVIRGTGGARKRDRDEPVVKELVLAQLHGGIELLLGNASQPVRDEVRRLNTDVRDWSHFINVLTSAELQPIVTQVDDMGKNINEDKVAKLLAPYMSPLIPVLRLRESLLQKELAALGQQCLLSLVRMLPDDGGFYDWKGFRAFLHSRLSFRMGIEAVPPVRAA